MSADDTSDPSSPIGALRAVMARLRDPKGGCPWDLAQDFRTISPYTVEEAYEVADAIERGDMEDLRDELGDLLLQVVYHTQMASEQGLFDFDDVTRGITRKMIDRHPHVFGDRQAGSPEDVNVIWEERKNTEKKRAQAESLLDDVALGLPALKRAQKIQKRAASVGFEWPEAGHVLDKLEEELGEMRAALKDGRQEEIIDELGDLFFVLVNFGRMLGADCEEVMKQANSKFSRRFRGIEQELKRRNVTFQDTTLEEMENIWQQQKKLEKKSG